ncbi:MAG: mRNA interferase MazF [Candidatus Woesearchaeota archaeon]|jgi:mRNA interferase MazF
MGTIRSVRRGEIWLVNFDPSLGHEIQKSRPAIIIQNDVGNAKSPLTVVVPLTSRNLDCEYPFELIIDKYNSTLKQTSKALFDQIRVIDKQRLIQKKGVLLDEAILEMNTKIKYSLALP